MRKFGKMLALLSVVLFGASCGGDPGGGGDGDVTNTELCALMITEFMADPKNPKKTGYEWIELYNSTGNDLDLRDFRLFIQPTGKSTQTMVFKGQDPVTVAAGGYIILDQQEDDTEGLNLTAALPTYMYPKSFALPSADFALTIRDLQGNEVFKVKVGATTDCLAETPTLPPATEGISLELHPDFFACDDVEASPVTCGAWSNAWKAAIPGSTDLGTPGAAPEVRFEGNPPQPGDLAVTEILSNPGASCADQTWLELRNLADEAFSLEGCILADATATGTLTIVSPVRLPPSSENGGYALLSKNAIPGVESTFVFGAKPSLNKTGDTLKLSCPPTREDLGDTANYQVIFEVVYGGGEGKLPACVEGASIGVFQDLIDLALGTGADLTPEILHDPAYWKVTPRGLMGCGTVLGSPGAANILYDCDPTCVAGTCGADDGCGAICGCGGSSECQDGTCVCSVTPDCTNRECGDDGCGGSCGTCGEGEACASNDATAACVGIPLPGELVPAEILPAGGDGCAAADWFELYNLSDRNLSLKGCILGDDSTSRHTITDAVVPAEGLLLLASADLAGVDGEYIFGGKPTLNNTGDRLFMTCPDGEGVQVEIFNLKYGGTDALPLAPKGKSAQLCFDRLADGADAAAMLDPASWLVGGGADFGCGDLGTPGAPNPDCDCDTLCDLISCDGPDGCGGTCGCGGASECLELACVCPVEADCTGKQCGDDGCGGSCGTCDEGYACAAVGDLNLCAATPAAGEVVPSEISSVTGVGCGGYDWFELWNLSARNLNLQGCSVGDASASGAAKIQVPVIIPAGARVVIAGGDLPGVAEALVSSKPNLNASGTEQLWLSCPDAGGTPVEIFRVTFGGVDALPATAAGASIQFCPEKIGADAPTAANVLLPANWLLSPGPVSVCGDKGTPGLPNDKCSCVKTCDGASCGNNDGCGGVCGCPGTLNCDTGTCVCPVVASCTDKACGDDGCGGSCGTCAEGFACATLGGKAICASTASPAKDEVVPVEIMSRSTGACASADWFELYNTTDRIFDLAGCVIYDATGTGKHTIAKQVLIPAKGIVLLAKADMPSVTEDYIYAKVDLNANDEDLGLDCPDAEGVLTTVFKVHYGGSAAGALPNTVAGASLALCVEKATPTSDWYNPTLWHPTTGVTAACGTDLASPGVANPSCDCTPVCEDGKCGGSDGCGGTCGCEPGEDCTEGLCTTPCTPSCVLDTCGMDDGCGTPCTCTGDLICDNGQCVVGEACANRDCGSDGKGGSCGSCPENFNCLETVLQAVCARAPVAGDLAVTEVMTNATLCGGGKDWFELINLSADKLDLSGCTLTDASATAGTVAAGTFIPGKDFLVFIQALASSGINLGTTKTYFYGSKPDLNSTGGDTLTLVCGANTVLTFTFGKVGEVTGFPLPATKDGAKASAQVAMTEGSFPTALEAADKANWCLSTNLLACGEKGTPGVTNGPCVK